MIFSGSYLSTKPEELPRMNGFETSFLYVSLQNQRNIKDGKLKTGKNSVSEVKLI